ncbi:type II toxin-antitoxin system RelE/ParE family toxin [Aliikangiella coralliicola]|uniref:Type II toxin-antitoxin system RelE/ParE family toxin n=1 Tax=Aliikangiella coralliicola TaxID=2592383 RepID=A0A545UCF0_9GAMM|nr:type II toxin-antitoxin system RelE/ParE family toxin [Aliikangiella coralliicola]TQV87144.1 type II toxin-antitoxin system RelE/ParE family toxin [Aliikangiella coralliicola]
MAQINWTEPALNDLNEIAEYIALDKPSAAKNLVKEIINSVKRLREFPESGRRPPELYDTRYRELIIGPCRIFYRVEEKLVFVLYVMRSERELRKFILEDRARLSS